MGSKAKDGSKDMRSARVTAYTGVLEGPKGLKIRLRNRNQRENALRTLDFVT